MTSQVVVIVTKREAEIRLILGELERIDDSLRAAVGMVKQLAEADSCSAGHVDSLTADTVGFERKLRDARAKAVEHNNEWNEQLIDVRSYDLGVLDAEWVIYRAQERARAMLGLPPTPIKRSPEADTDSAAPSTAMECDLARINPAARLALRRMLNWLDKRDRKTTPIEPTQPTSEANGEGAETKPQSDGTSASNTPTSEAEKADGLECHNIMCDFCRTPGDLAYCGSPEHSHDCGCRMPSDVDSDRKAEAYDIKAHSIMGDLFVRLSMSDEAGKVVWMIPLIDADVVAEGIKRAKREAMEADRESNGGDNRK